ncbi:alpha/beta fold hydrolase [Sulfurimonas sp. HSL1-6]|uniref:alpha/beta hydrolase n=1 Tax=Thiomicrolovo immobilis TaxID=3131935 RepID=UPI0031F8B61C
MTVVLTVLGTILLLWGILFLVWPRLVFAPVYYPNRDAFHLHPERFHGLERVRGGNVVLEGVVYEPESPRCTVFYFGGKEQDSVALVGKLSERFPAWRIIAFNYRGYGRSGGRPGERLLLEDAVALVAYARERFGPLMLMGYSLGSSVAAYAASRTSVTQLILVAPFYDVPSLARLRILYLPAWMMRCRFETARYLGGVSAPVSIFASRDDEIVPIEQSHALKAKAPRLAVYKEYSGYNHAEILGSDRFIADVSKVC